MAKILVVDDNAYTRQMLTAILVPEGHEVIGAADGQDLISLYEENEPDIVMLDVVMPNVDGITAARELLNVHPEAKVIIESAQQASALQQEAKDMGIIGYVPKPFDVETITAVMKEALK
ncbi:MAG: response regulator [Lachnospiraceae bacterium]|nr:response regulator [Lachnospiraceae bacterium]